MGKFVLKNSIFRRLVTIFLLIMIPIYMLGIYVYYWGIRTTKQEISNSTIAQSLFYIKGLEKEIERIRILQYDCLNDDNLNKLAIRWDVLNDYNRSESMRQLQQRLITIKNSSEYIKDVSAHILPIGRTISATNAMDAIAMDVFKAIRVPAGVTGAQLISHQSGLYLSTLQLSNLSFNNSMYSIVIELNIDELKQAITQFNTYTNSGSFLIDLRSNRIILDRHDAVNSALAESILSNLKQTGDSGMDYVTVSGKGYYTVFVKSQYLDMTLVRYIPEEYILQPLKNFYVWVWIFSIVAIGIILVYAFSAYKYMHKPLLELVKSFHKVEMGNLSVSIDHNSNDEFGYLYKRFNDMVKNLNLSIEQVYKQKILMQRAELKQLQSQINPHFLYNSFFVLNTMAHIGDENLIAFTRQLGEYFRFLTRNASDFISLSEEINHAKVYLGIQSIRFSKRLRTSFAECPETYMSLSVPRLILQPIIENAFEHGIEKNPGAGIIQVGFAEAETGLNIIIEDNGSDMTDEGLAELQRALAYSGEDAEVTGILNIHRRIRLVFGPESGLRVSRSDLGGLKVTLSINLTGGAMND